MNQISRFLTIASLLALFGLLAFASAPSAEGAFYKYTDKNGVVHFTDRLESIPSEYRNQIKEYKEIEQPEAPPPPEKGASKDPGATDKERQLQEAEQKKKETEAKAAQEAKQKAREEKQKQISALQEQIAAKQKEAGSLRTNWMVYDRIKVNQLNEEIASLEKQIEALQNELSGSP